MPRPIPTPPPRRDRVSSRSTASTSAAEKYVRRPRFSPILPPPPASTTGPSSRFRNPPPKGYTSAVGTPGSVIRGICSDEGIAIAIAIAMLGAGAGGRLVGWSRAGSWNGKPAVAAAKSKLS
uniref:Sbp1 n=1 Tax=Arundo donax TaxID=35708 RepID=A0A0A9DM11_ARUDO